MARSLRVIGFATLLASAVLGGTAMAPAPAQAQQSSDPIVTLQTQVFQLYNAGRFAEVAPLAEQLVELNRARFGAGSREHAVALYQAGNVLTGIARFADAETYLRQALAIFSTNPANSEQQTQTEVMLASALVYQSKFEEGLPLMHRSTTALESRLGLRDHRAVIALNNLAQTLQMSGRSAEAEPIYRRLIASRDPNDPANFEILGTLHASLAAVLAQVGRQPEALSEMRRAVELLRRLGNKDHVFLATALNNLGQLEQNVGNFAAAEVLYRDSLEIIARVTGTDRENYATSLSNLSGLQRDQGRYAEAEETNRRALAIFERELPPHHPKTGSVSGSLAALLSMRGAWSEALTYYERATESAIRNARALKSEDGRVAQSVYGLNPEDYPAHIRAIHRVAPEDPVRQAQAFSLLQRALNSRTAAAISRMAARAAAPGSALAGLLREQQDLLRRRGEVDKALIAAHGGSEPNQSVRARGELDRLDAALVASAQRVATEFPEYAALDSTEPVPLADIQSALMPQEALVAFVEVPSTGTLPNELHAWVITGQTVTWRKLDVPSRPPGWRVPTLRCGLDAEEWRKPGGRGACEQLTGARWSETDEAAGKLLPYHLERAHDLYKELLRPLEDVLRLPNGQWRDLLVVVTGPLATLPLAALVTEVPPAPFVADLSDYRTIKWLGRRQPITILPAIASLTALRRIARASAATEAMIGFGNPLLDGPDARYAKLARDARSKQRCPEKLSQRVASFAGRRSATAAVPMRQGQADLAHLRQQTPLPETADELCAVARDLNADPREIRLGARATEREVKALSAAASLARYKIIHFATHGALAGQISGSSEPGLVLTPPKVATPDDDGYLAASDIATLKLDADWVILSACNTAGAEGAAGGEALSGLARAFFYAGARALLVSHWAVDSDASVKLVSAAVGAIGRDSRLGRAEALRRAMTAMIDGGQLHQAHPTYWSPFVVVGEGGAARR